MGGMMPPDEPPVVPADVITPMSPDLRPPEAQLNGAAAMTAPSAPLRLNIHPNMLTEVQVVPFFACSGIAPSDLNNSHETPAEEFRTLRTRLNHLQSLQPLHTIVVTSPSPAEGKTFTAATWRWRSPTSRARPAGRSRSTTSDSAPPLPERSRAGI